MPSRMCLQERGLRSGTVPSPLAVGLGAACELAQHEMDYDAKHIRSLAERLYNNITAQVPANPGATTTLHVHAVSHSGRACSWLCISWPLVS